MSPESQPTLSPQAVLGVVIALLGVIFTLDNLGLANTELVFRYWPLAAIAVGVAICMQAAQTRDWVFGVLWMAGGALLLARNLGWITVHLKQLMPLLLVALGARLIWRSPPKVKPRTVTPPPVPVTDVGPEPGAGAPDQGWQSPAWPGQGSQSHGWPAGGRPWASTERNAPDVAGGASGPSDSRSGWTHFSSKSGRINVFAILGGVERRVRSEVFTGAELTAILGGCELDLREARMGGEEANIAAFALWGGIEIRVPPDWTVVNESTALMGGVEDATRPQPGPGRPRLVVRGFALMGGIEIKN